jgi:type II secretory pathway component PulJ
MSEQVNHPKHYEQEAKRIEDLKKARWYLDREIQRLEAGQ